MGKCYICSDLTFTKQEDATLELRQWNGHAIVEAVVYYIKLWIGLQCCKNLVNYTDMPLKGVDLSLVT